MKYNCLLLTVLALLAGLVCDSAVAQQKGNETDLEETQSGLIGSKNVSNVAESFINKTDIEKNDTVVSGLAAAPATSITLDEFNKACATKGGSGGPDHYRTFLTTVKIAKCFNKVEACKLLAHVVWETKGLRQLEDEFCTVPGNANICKQKYGSGPNGVIYYPRGCLKVSGQEYYRNFSKWEFGDGNESRLVKNPGMVAASILTAWDSAGWFWKKNVHDHSGTFGKTLEIIRPSDCSNWFERCNHYNLVRVACGLPEMRNLRPMCECPQ